jgi:hypothetical protein
VHLTGPFWTWGVARLSGDLPGLSFRLFHTISRIMLRFSDWKRDFIPAVFRFSAFHSSFAQLTMGVGLWLTIALPRLKTCLHYPELLQIHRFWQYRD